MSRGIVATAEEGLLPWARTYARRELAHILPRHEDACAIAVEDWAQDLAEHLFVVAQEWVDDRRADWREVRP